MGLVYSWSQTQEGKWICWNKVRVVKEKTYFNEIKELTRIFILRSIYKAKVVQAET